MRHSWTGGQYSAWRALLGFSLVLCAALEMPTGTEGGLHAFAIWLTVIVLGSALAIGFRDRLAALLLAILGVAVHHDELVAGEPESWALVVMLLLHAATHGSPYGTIDARGRADPGGNWIFPRWNFALRRLVVVAASIACVARGSLDLPWPIAAAIVLSICDPGWIPPLRGSTPTSVFYDGGCGLCHHLVRLLLAEDFTGRTFRFAPLESQKARSVFDERERALLPDSVVVKTAEGATLIRSRGALHLLARLGGLWRAIGGLARLAPASWLDAGYNFVARVRHRLFARPPAACPIVPPHLAARFDP